MMWMVHQKLTGNLLHTDEVEIWFFSFGSVSCNEEDSKEGQKTTGKKREPAMNACLKTANIAVLFRAYPKRNIKMFSKARPWNSW